MSKLFDDDEPKKKGWSPLRIGLCAGVGLAALLTLSGCFYTVSPTEMAGVRRFGQVVSPEPIGPGLHFKLPWIETVDTIQTSLTKLAVDNLNVYTIDNQPVTISLRLTYQVPKSAVFHLMYDVGKAGDFDTFATIEPVIADRAMRVFAEENTVTISEDRTKLAHEIEKQVQDAVQPLFGLQVRDLQIIGIKYSQSFETSIGQAVRAKNDAIRAENIVNQKKYEADQVVIEAQGKAKAAVEAAQGEAKAIAVKAEAQAKAIQLVGSAVTANPQIVQYEYATRWNGTTPTTVLGTGAVPFFNIGHK